MVVASSMFLLRVIGGAFLKQMLKRGVRLLADWAEAPWVGEVGESVITDWKIQQPDESERRAELEAVAKLTQDELRREIDEIKKAIAANQPEEIRNDLDDALIQVPGLARRMLTRPTDVTGTTVPFGMPLRRARDVAPIIPTRRPRFRAGMRPNGIGNRVLLEPCGAGGMGEVWKAANPDSPESGVFALKFFRDDEEGREFLRNETKVLGEIRIHQEDFPGVVMLREFHPRAEHPCVEYEYVDGGDLVGLMRDWSEPGKAPSPENVARVILEIADAVGPFHRLKPAVVHRDLKPANILVKRRADGTIRLKIADFGIGGFSAKAILEATKLPTRAGILLPSVLKGSHTPLYASQEQIEGEDPDPRDDVHAIGVIWHQLLTLDWTRPVTPGFEDDLAERKVPAGHISLIKLCLSPARRRPEHGDALAAALRGLMPDGSTLDLRSNSTSAPAEVKPVEEPRTKIEESIIKPLGMPLKLIPAGEFEMGSPDSDSSASADEKPRHPVKISRPFYLGVHPVTQAEYETLMKSNPSKYQGPRNPVENVSWFDAVRFCNDLSRHEGLPEFYRIEGSGDEARVTIRSIDGLGYRLPTEAEWEYACRAGTAGKYSFGDAEKDLGTHAWYTDNSGGQTHPVGLKSANPWGLADMHGGVWEWCWDWYDENFYKKKVFADPIGGNSGQSRVFRGGSIDNGTGNLRSALRGKRAPASRFEDHGFRLSRTSG